MSNTTRKESFLYVSDNKSYVGSVVFVAMMHEFKIKASLLFRSRKAGVSVGGQTVASDSFQSHQPITSRHRGPWLNVIGQPD
jgi:hypothetical protein